jgi:FkbH-like protein
MVLRMKNFAAFRANWEPKSENIRQIAADLNLGIDSLVFIDDNPAEIDIVKQFVPEVETVWVGADPTEFIARLQSARLFEPLTVTAEDTERSEQYQQEARRQQLLTSCTDMKGYLQSLEMKGIIREFRAVDAPRISQLINKSNQFNLTTRRRTEAEVLELISQPDCAAFTMRLTDRFGDHGLIAVVIGRKLDETFAIDTWLMSCRVLKRQVEEEVVNEIARLAARLDAKRIAGLYLPTSKNGMVRDLYPRMGFAVVSEAPDRSEFELDLGEYQIKPTEIEIVERAYDSV